MNSDGVIKSIGDIDPEFIKEARPSNRSRLLLRAAGCAAAVLILIGAFLALPGLIGGDPQQGKQAELSAGDPAVTEKAPVAAGSNGTSAGGSAEPGDAAPAYGAVIRDVFTGANGENYFCLRRSTLAQTVSMHHYIAEAVLEGCDAETGLLTFAVTRSFAKELPETILVSAPTYSGTSLEGTRFTLQAGRPYILFLSRRANVFTDSEFYFAEEMIRQLEGQEPESFSISDISDMDYNEIVEKLPGLIAENPCVKPDEITGDYLHSSDIEEICSASEAVILASVTELCPEIGRLTGDRIGCLVSLESIIKGDPEMLGRVFGRDAGVLYNALTPQILVPRDSVEPGEAYVFCLKSIDETNTMFIITAPGSVYPADSDTAAFILNK